MDKNSNPLDYIISCCEQGLVPSSFDILNAKDELQKLKEQAQNFYLIGWSRINALGDIYDPRFYFNPHIDQSIVLPIYANKKEYQEKYGNLSKPTV